MSLKQIIEDHIEEKLKNLNYSLVKLNVIYGKRKNKLEVVIFHPNGITHKDCTLVSKAITEDEFLDKELGENYLLEVSSPGIDRKLKTLRDFQVFCGSLIEFALIEEGKPALGLIEKVEEPLVYIKDRGNNKIIKVILDEIQYAKLSDEGGKN